MNYDMSNTKAYCKELDLVYLGDDFVRNADNEARALGFTQQQFDAAMCHHLWQVKWLFTPKNYSWFSRIKIALYFIFGCK